MDWTHLAPTPELVAEQPAAFVSAARTTSKEAVVYTPEARQLRLRRAELPPAFDAEWVSAASGEKAPAQGKASGEITEFETPAPGDWLLLLRPKPAPR